MLLHLAAWCALHNLEINHHNMMELVVDFRKHPPSLPPLNINNSTVPVVDSVKFLGTTITNDFNTRIPKAKTFIQNHQMSISENVLPHASAR